MKRSSWIIRVDPKSSDSCLYTRKTEGDLRQKKRRKSRRNLCDHRGKGGRDAATSPGPRPEPPEGGRGRRDPPPAPRKGAQPCLHLHLGLLASRLRENTLLLFYDLQSMVCDNSHRRLLQTLIFSNPLYREEN